MSDAKGTELIPAKRRVVPHSRPGPSFELSHKFRMIVEFTEWVTPYINCLENCRNKDGVDQNEIVETIYVRIKSRYGWLGEEVTDKFDTLALAIMEAVADPEVEDE